MLGIFWYRVEYKIPFRKEVGNKSVDSFFLLVINTMDRILVKLARRLPHPLKLFVVLSVKEGNNWI